MPAKKYNRLKHSFFPDVRRVMRQRQKKKTD